MYSISEIIKEIVSEFKNSNPQWNLVVEVISCSAICSSNKVAHDGP